MVPIIGTERFNNHNILLIGIIVLNIGYRTESINGVYSKSLMVKIFE